jgi:hypothetical protein
VFDLKKIMIGGSRKLGIFFVLFFLLAVSLATLNTSNASTPLYVNGSSGDDRWDGTSPSGMGSTLIRALITL